MKSTDNMHNRETKQLTGPKGIDKWTAWRKARNKAIESPRRLMTCKDKDVNDERSTAASKGDRA